MLVDRIGVDQGKLANELNKLLMFNSEITQDAIKQLTDRSPEDSIFALTDAVTNNNLQTAVAVYQDLRARQMHPLEILGTLGWHIHSLVQVSVLSEKSQPKIAKQTKLHPFVVQKLHSRARQLERDDLLAIVDIVIQAEGEMKGKSAHDLDAIFQTMLIRLAEI